MTHREWGVRALVGGLAFAAGLLAGTQPGAIGGPSPPPPTTAPDGLTGEPRAEWVSPGIPGYPRTPADRIPLTHVLRDHVPVWERPRSRVDGEPEIRVVLSLNGHEWDVRVTLPRPR